MPKPLTIGVDVRPLRIAATGTKTYLAEICREFKNMETDELRFHFLDTPFQVSVGKNKMHKWLGHFRYQLWKQIVLPIKAFYKNCDIVFCTDEFVPLIHLGYRTIPVFHDAFFFESPENYGKLWLWLYLKTAVPAAKRSPFVVTPSAWSKKQISHFTQIPDEKLVVIYEGPKKMDDQSPANGACLLLSSFSLTPASYLLHVGSMFKRKNLPSLIDAFGLLKSIGYPKLKLVLAGSPPASKLENDYPAIMEAIENTGLGEDVILTGYLSDEKLAQLYYNALLYVFPSTNEGFGIPLLEAFKHDLPVLAANNTCLPEIGGDAVLLFNPYDTNELFLKLKTVLDDVNLQQEMIIKGRERLKNFSWQKTAAELAEVFRKAV